MLNAKFPVCETLNLIACLPLVVPAISLSEFLVPSGDIILFELILA
jgi:hypothetical protein